MAGTIVLIIIGIIVFIAYTKYRKKNIASLDDFIISNKIPATESEYENEIYEGKHTEKEFLIHYTEYKYSQFNLPRIAHLLEGFSVQKYDCEDCDYPMKVGNDEYNNIKVQKAFKLYQNPLSNVRKIIEEKRKLRPFLFYKVGKQNRIMIMMN